jgi:hypothetical protein
MIQMNKTSCNSRPSLRGANLSVADLDAHRSPSLGLGAFIGSGSA